MHADARSPLRLVVHRVVCARCAPPSRLSSTGIAQTQHPAPAHSRPTNDAEAQRGRIKISGKKPGFDSVSIYSQKKGDVQWKIIAVRKRKFPYYDESPLTVPNTPEVREYMAIGVVKDEEIGETSEIKEAVYAG